MMTDEHVATVYLMVLSGKKSCEDGGICFVDDFILSGHVHVHIQEKIIELELQVVTLEAADTADSADQVSMVRAMNHVLHCISA